jgi:predicted ATPase
MMLTVMSGREIKIPKAAHGVAVFDFTEIGDKAYGSMDFIAICRNFHSVILKNVPRISLSSKNNARRFILFVLNESGYINYFSH